MIRKVHDCLVRRTHSSKDLPLGHVDGQDLLVDTCAQEGSAR
jgi:hypothetical protein